MTWFDTYNEFIKNIEKVTQLQKDYVTNLERINYLYNESIKNIERVNESEMAWSVFEVMGTAPKWKTLSSVEGSGQI